MAQNSNLNVYRSYIYIDTSNIGNNVFLPIVQSMWEEKNDYQEPMNCLQV